MAKKYSRRSSRKHRGRKHHSRRHGRRQRGGDSMAAPVSGNPMGGMMAQSLAQGQQYANIHANQHGGGGLDAGPYPGAVTDQSLLPDSLKAAARVAPLDSALSAIANMKDPGQAGGGRRRRGSKKSRKARKGSRKARKGSRKARKGSRKTRKMRGGAAYVSSPASVSAPGMLLDSSQMAKALSGMNAEWKLAENPASFAPGVAKNY